MRIAIIVPGGVGSGLHGQGIPILVDWIERLAKKNDLTVFSLVKLNLDYQPENYELVGTELAYFDSVWRRILHTYRLIKKAHQEKPFHLIHGIWLFPAGFIAIIAAKMLHCKSMASLQGGDIANIKSIQYGGNQTFLKRFLNNWVLKRLDVLTVLSDFLKKMIPQETIREQTHIIPYGSDFKPFNYKEKELNIPIQFIHIGNINNVKDQSTLIRAFHIIQQKIDARLNIVGPDYYEGKIQALCIELGLQNKVNFVGFQTYEKIPFWLKKSDIMLHTSLHEGMAMVVVEAFAAGVLVCGTHVGIMHDLADKCCLTVELGDYKNLAKKTLDLIENQSLQKKLRNNAYEWSEIHTLDWTVEQFSHLYSSSTH